MKRDFKYAYVVDNGDSPDDLTWQTISYYSSWIWWFCKQQHVVMVLACIQGGNAYCMTLLLNRWLGFAQPDGTNKTVSTRKGFLTERGRNIKTPLWQKNYFFGSNLASVSKPATTGEETFHTGMDYGFMNGMYDGAQNNTGGSFNYSDSFTLSSSLIQLDLEAERLALLLNMAH